MHIHQPRFLVSLRAFNRELEITEKTIVYTNTIGQQFQLKESQVIEAIMEYMTKEDKNEMDI